MKKVLTISLLPLTILPTMSCTTFNVDNTKLEEAKDKILQNETYLNEIIKKYKCWVANNTLEPINFRAEYINKDLVPNIYISNIDYQWKGNYIEVESINITNVEASFAYDYTTFYKKQIKPTDICTITFDKPFRY